jgi:hypothetical protein
MPDIPARFVEEENPTCGVDDGEKQEQEGVH